MSENIYRPILEDFAAKVIGVTEKADAMNGPLAFISWIISTDETSKALKGYAERFINGIEKCDVDIDELFTTYNESVSGNSDLRNEAIQLRAVIKGFWDVSGENLGITEEAFNETVGMVALEKAIANIPGKGRKQNGATVTVDSEAGKIREWAKSNGYEIGERGRISQEIREAYAKSNK
jgi:hypothetical protein